MLQYLDWEESDEEEGDLAEGEAEWKAGRELDVVSGERDESGRYGLRRMNLGIVW
jgi:hypothetical protein